MEAEIAHRKKRLEELKNKEEVLPMAPTMPGGDPPSISEQEFFVQIERLHNDLKETCIKEMSQVHRKRLLIDLLNMKEGGLNHLELRRQIFVALNQEVSGQDIDPREKEIVRKALKYDDAFLMHTLTNDISESTRKLVEEAIQARPSEEFSPFAERVDALFLETVPPFRKRAFLKEKTRLHFAMGFGSSYNFGWGQGGSMSPAIPKSKSLMYARGLTEATVNQVSIGDVVSFVMVKPNGHPGIAGKRIKGMDGDVVDDIQGKRMIVPAGHFWALGDNAAESLDSRHCGAVPLTNLRKHLLVNISTSFPFIRFL